MERTALSVAAAVFSIGALVHLGRLIFHFSVAVGGWELPLWLNGVGLFITASLAIWMWRVALQDRSLKPPWER